MGEVRYENGIFGMIPQDEWLDVGFNVTRPNDPIDGLFGDQKTDNIVAQWQTIATQYQIPEMAQFHGFDTEAQTAFRVPIDTHNIEKGLIKVKMNQSERMRTLLRSGVRNDQMYDYILNDGINLADRVVTRTKVAKNELMATGKITIKENNLDLTVDYGVPAAQTQFTIDIATTSDLSAQIQDIIDAATAQGVIITGMMTSKKVITKMRANAGLQRNINGNVGVGALVRSQALKDYLSEEFGINTIITNDLTYRVPAGLGSNGRPVVTTKRYFPQDKITFFATNPNGRMGIGLWGDPPEVDIEKFGTTVGTESSVSPYVYVSQYSEKDPAVIWTKASALFIPVLYNPNSLFIATATDSLATPSITTKPSSTTVAVGGTRKITATTVPADATITWTSSDTTKATVSNGTVTGVAAGSATITASITVDGTTYTDTTIVTVTAS